MDTLQGTLKCTVTIQTCVSK